MEVETLAFVLGFEDALSRRHDHLAQERLHSQLVVRVSLQVGEAAVTQLSRHQGLQGRRGQRLQDPP